MVQMCPAYIAEEAPSFQFPAYLITKTFLIKTKISMFNTTVFIWHVMSMKRNLNDRMFLTKLPVTTAVISETCAKPSNTTSYMLLLAFFKPKQIDNIL